MEEMAQSQKENFQKRSKERMSCYVWKHTQVPFVARWQLIPFLVDHKTESRGWCQVFI